MIELALCLRIAWGPAGTKEASTLDGIYVQRIGAIELTRLHRRRNNFLIEGAGIFLSHHAHKLSY